MALTKCNVPKDVIGSLGTNPSERGLTTQQFKDKFDEMPEGIIDYLNNTLTEELDPVVGKVATLEAERIGANKTIYVATTGNDTTGNGTSGNPYATITKALSVIPKNLNGYIATINIAAGSYSETVNINYFFGGRINITLAGNVTITGLNIAGTFVTISGAYTLTTGTLQLNYASYLEGFSDISITVNGQATFYGISNTSIGLANNSSMRLPGTVTISGNTGSAVVLRANASGFIGTLAGSTTGIGINIGENSRFGYGSRTLTASTAETTGAGGRIYSGAQTSVPNY